MASVKDKVGREFQFDRIRYKLDEELIQQAGTEIVDQSSGRAQAVFDRYCALHLLKYKRNYEPSHFASGRLLSRCRTLYETTAPTISVTIVLKAGPLFDKFIGQPPEYIEHAVRYDPRAWVNSGSVVAVQT